MIVAVYARFSDMCANNDYYLHGYYDVESVEQAKEVFPENFLVGWRVEVVENLIKQLPTTVQKVPQEKFYQ
jgi:hypothetical protein